MHIEKLKLYETRVNNFYNRLSNDIISKTIPLDIEYRHSNEPILFADRLNGKYEKVKEGEIWGLEWESAWFHLKGTVPVDWNKKMVVAQLDFNGEALVFDSSGCPVYGLTNGSVFDEDNNKDIYRLFRSVSGNENVEIWVEAAANSLFGINKHIDTKDDDPKKHGDYEGRIVNAKLAVFNEDVWHLWLDIQVMNSLIKYLPEKSVRRVRVLCALNDVANFYGNNRLKANESRNMLKAIYDTPANASDMKVAAVGHAHIDTAWLWPVRETIRKCARTFASQINLLENYPDYVFGASQAQHYLFVKQYYPALYKKIKKYVAEGRWEIQGATWVECDCNLISGESMIRQFIHGKNFYMDEFGVDVKNLWLPDVFGYSAAMPQIMKKTGVNFFLTQKISWNMFNQFPHHTFKWRGLDGSEIVTHFPPENNYNSFLLPDELGAAQDRFSEKDVLDEFLCLFGIGDGGGGPKEEYIERALREKDLEGCPKVHFKRADKFFEDVIKQSHKLDTWDGELYLELHRGTYTTQAQIKRNNRFLENRLRQVEFIFACLPEEQYPRKELDLLWKKLLLNQFHDIIPGSSIHMVYKTAEKEYIDAFNSCMELENNAADSLFTKDKNSLVLFNCLSHAYTQAIVLPKSWGNDGVKDDKGNVLPSQNDDNGNVVSVEIPPMSFLTLKRTKECIPNSILSDSLILENNLVKYEFQKNGELIYAFDKELSKELLVDGEHGNLFSLYVDRPHNWDAWDIDIYYESQLLEHATFIDVKSLGSGDVRQGLKFQLKIGKSNIYQNIYLSNNSKRLDFQTKIEWDESHNMLRVSFPTTIYQREYSSDIQYGYVKRATHRNTSWDMAKFETVAHRYVDLSNFDHGIALLNDCKYGHKVFENIIDLNLLRSSTNPDPIADIGTHHFTYSLLPHSGNLVNSNVIEESAMLNLKARVFVGENALAAQVPVKLSGKGISIEAFKFAEKENIQVIRLVEIHGSLSKCILNVNAKQLVECDLLEWTEGEIIGAFKPVEITLKPFEIRTYKLKN